MKTTNSLLAQYILIGIWLSGFIYSLLVVVITIPAFEPESDMPSRLLSNVLDIFSPQLGVMLAFFFSDLISKRRMSLPNKGVVMIAIVISGLYVGLFCSLMFVFQYDIWDIRASDIVVLVEAIRPKLSFLITAMAVYFFAVRT